MALLRCAKPTDLTTARDALQELLFDHLQTLIARAIAAPQQERASTIHEFVCKVEEVHVSLHKHLRKEEEQLFPLLLQHFAFEEQAELVVQFVCCIPVSAVKGVLAWLKKSCPAPEQAALCFYVTSVTTDTELRRLLNLWLQPDLAAQLGSSSPPLWPPHPPPHTPLPPPLTNAHTAATSLRSTRTVAAQPSPQPQGVACASHATPSSPEPPAPAASGANPGPAAEPGPSDSTLPAQITQQAQQTQQLYDPLDSLVHLHAGILLMLRSLMAEVRQVHSSGHIQLVHVESLVDRRRFLCAISSFHRLSEHEFVYPAARELGHGVDACLHCEEDHREESELLTRLGCLLADLESCIRRSSKVRVYPLFLETHPLFSRKYTANAAIWQLLVSMQSTCLGPAGHSRRA